MPTLETWYADPKTPVEHRIAELGPWFHNLHLPDGSQTAPDHQLGDFPRNKWVVIDPHIPADLNGWTVMDLGCNAGFYAFELARRGAMVTAVDMNAGYLRQAQWAAEQFGLADRIEFRCMQFYDAVRSDERFDIVWFMGLLYHLRYPLLALDMVSRMVNRLMVFQTLTMPGEKVIATPDDIGIMDRDLMCHDGWPVTAFIEKRLAGDPTNWWAPNHAGVEAMLRSSGFAIVRRIDSEIYLCEPDVSDVDSMREMIDAERRSASGIDRFPPHS